MTVRLTGNVILLEGECRVEDAEPLLALLQGQAACTLPSFRSFWRWAPRPSGSAPTRSFVIG
jgi:hypothetical protein